jgi:transcriptional regulator with XRE-family HTH domain
MESERSVGRRIRSIRRRRGLTQKALAKRVGRSVNTLSALERGICKPGFDTLLLLASALGVPARDFFTPGAGDGADSPEHAALYEELLGAARALPLAELALAVRITGAVAGWISEVGSQKSEVRGTGPVTSDF